MRASRLVLTAFPATTMIAVVVFMPGIEHWLAAFGKTAQAKLMLGRIGLALPYATAAAIGTIFLFAANGTAAIKAAGWGIVSGNGVAILIAVLREGVRLAGIAGDVPAGQSVLGYVDPATMLGASTMFLAGVFALRVAMKGNAAFAKAAPRRIGGKRAVHGEADWMKVQEAAKLFPDPGGIVVGERYRVDRDSVAAVSFRADDPSTWGAGGKSQLLCFDGSFGSSHGIVFAGSGGFKTTSVTVPTALKWGGGLVVLDPSSEVAPMVSEHRRKAGRKVVILDPSASGVGFNALDWIGRRGSTKEEDIVAVATWIMTDNSRSASARDDFFRASAMQLLTALIADVCLSGHTDEEDQTLRRVRKNLSEPEPQLRARLTKIYEQSESGFVKENVSVFVNMTPETFSGVYANAVKETHWLSYPNYAALVSGDSFSTDDLADGGTDIFIALDLKVLEAHPGLARVVIGSLLNAIYNRNGDVKGRALFLLDEVARLGYLRILETARDAGRKYGITLTMIFQSIGQMREAYGGRDATSKWFESASWISFAAINDPDTADYISKRCGDTTVEVEQTNRSSGMKGSSRSRSRQLSRRPLILPHEVLRMRSDEQIVFTSGNPPLRCGRAIWFRRKDMSASVGENRFHSRATEGMKSYKAVPTTDTEET
ncbi:Ti-type conjugative transfer system protein TraG [Agrobacterium rosae]|uniref:Ti-type conjugative transfer system protein TraG n=4 Tax=Rhizobium/Agrobacterium group TaxID=227290 RepID=A0AAE5RTI7_9HYPH|nr:MULTISPECIES: Ti-type conjugative transfer system protein TraG [Agrobacterium]KAA3509088.1 Ti-type conjugative transfer system protein TraG [Agrobacterium rosae]KAA3513785.1 Ti-type conjugative transfer system protein TraG [Agrobacterium rosae]MBN7808291.1 Ti-type conjugative transfer system protein TraG [Agrobacterium rosae]MCM2435744.1 Ti-type conjugative transfer system protein TraG [Agrobacterium rosae]MDX8310969.1 Ti-type conjugative transfer system protein TraG [Agrobacterium sp. rho-